MIEKIDLSQVLNIAIEAGKEIIDVYNTEFEIEQKADESPLTIADRKSHQVIESQLYKQFPKIPVLSEEGKHQSYAKRQDWTYAWVVDPLDGTKEFIKRNGEFTVNIALIENGIPVLGVIYAPVLDIAYIAKKGVGSYKLDNVSDRTFSTEEEIIQGLKLPVSEKRDYISVVASRSHLSKETEEYVDRLREKYGEVDMTSAGSSLKLCLVAEGKADVYPRFAPTMEWDTAAGQAIVEQSGGTVVKVDNSEPLSYNKEDLLNPWFIVQHRKL
ncbi:3'(2'),5'-bisphosphate nucleotidase CysQ [Alkalihalobacterium sp. APHAB7]|uniref:3'(2'),5'-bisphosphate nucleotidase CysQ n=1 Tax=Alkalihalobacterium sp. APHAB7 TaxID=3402081 RepID=UPI003AAE3FAE